MYVRFICTWAALHMLQEEVNLSDAVHTHPQDRFPSTDSRRAPERESCGHHTKHNHDSTPKQQTTRLSVNINVNININFNYFFCLLPLTEDHNRTMSTYPCTQRISLAHNVSRIRTSIKRKIQCLLPLGSRFACTRFLGKTSEFSTHYVPTFLRKLCLRLSVS